VQELSNILPQVVQITILWQVWWKLWNPLVLVSSFRLIKGNHYNHNEIFTPGSIGVSKTSCKPNLFLWGLLIFLHSGTVPFPPLASQHCCVCGLPATALWLLQSLKPWSQCRSWRAGRAGMNLGDARSHFFELKNIQFLFIRCVPVSSCLPLI
jgi:hypothetical protein